MVACLYVLFFVLRLLGALLGDFSALQGGAV